MNKPISLPELAIQREQWRAANKTVVLTNGVFDLLHYGHLQYLQAARALGDVLVVGLNSDASTRRYKGPLRPLVPEQERAALLLALEPVDEVVLFDEPTAEQLVATLQPEIYCKGGDYGAGAKHLPEAAVVEAYGGRVEFISYLPGRSTSELITLIRQRYGT
jgi:D-glycero-beta-D-manno-heptose 1-phosphate adenylyltransferase